jgi:hypothetical protein
MEKFGHIPRAKPPRPPLEVVIPPMVDKLIQIMGLNGYEHIGMTIVMHALDTSETAMGGNLNETGMRALLSSALAKLADVPTMGEEAEAELEKWRCTCGKPELAGVIHRVDLPCYVVDDPLARKDKTP